MLIRLQSRKLFGTIMKDKFFLEMKTQHYDFKMASQTFKLSPSAISLMNECHRCFWLTQHKKWKRPEGPFPSLPAGMDKVLKTHFDKFMNKGELPPEIREYGISNGYKLFDDKNQMDIYNFLLRKNGYETEDYSYLLFYYPKEVNDFGEVIFYTKLIKIATSSKNGEAIFGKAIRLLLSDCPTKTCEWCDGR